MHSLLRRRSFSCSISAVVRAVVLKALQISITRVFVDSGKLIILFTFGLSDQTRSGNEFNIYLYSLPWKHHLLVRLWSIFRVGQLDGGLTCFQEYPVEAGNGAGVASLP